MSVKAGGIKDNPDTSPNESNIIGFGYDGMLYAALNGADIINASWGGTAASEFEEDILNTVAAMGPVIVAASGNNGVDEVFYPAAFRQTLAVGAVDTAEDITPYSNYGYNLDVLAAGSNIWGSIRDLDERDELYFKFRGTSMSSPIVAGLAALIKSKYPEWSGQRIQQQIRSTSRRIDINGNDDRKYQLGHGYVDAQRAVTTPMPGLQVLSSQFLNNEEQKLDVDQPGTLRLKVANYGESISDLTLQLQTPQDHISLPSPRKQGLALAHNDTAEFAFELTIESDFNLLESPTFILDMEGKQGAYSDFHRFVYRELLYDVISSEGVLTSFASNGTVGFTNAFEGTGGVGFQPRRRQSDSFVSGPNLLFEGGLMISFDRSVKDAVRSVDGELSRDFKPLSTFRIAEPGTVSDIDGNTQFGIQDSTSNLSDIHIDLQTYAFDHPDINNAVYIKYDITNRSYENRQLRDVFVGLFNDWDLGSVVDNSTAFFEEDSLLYVYDEAGNVPYFVGVTPINEISSLFAIDNTVPSTGGPLDIGLYDGFTDSEKHTSMTAGTQKTEVRRSDISTVVASGPYHIGPRSNITVGFIYAYGNSLEELRSQINAARQRNLFTTSSTGLHLQTGDKPESTRIYQNYPNPFNNKTNIRVDLAERQQLRVEVYNVVGQKVKTLANREFSSGIHTLQLDGSGLSTGLYFVDIRTPTTHRTLKVSLVK